MGERSSEREGMVRQYEFYGNGSFASPGRLCLEKDNHALRRVEQDHFPVGRWESGMRGSFLRGEQLVISEDRLLMSCHR